MRATTTNSRKTGFSLVELLAVIAIISVMAAVIGLSLPDNTSANLKSGQSAAIGMFQAARTVASMRRTDAAVIIYADNSGGLDAEKKYLRYMGVVYWADTNDDGEGDTWLPANSGVYLPAGVFYVPENGDGGRVSVEDSETSLISSSNSQTDSFTYPVTAAGANPNQWYYYAFNSDGSAKSPGDIVVFGAGRSESDDGEVSDVIIKPYQTNGFAVRRFGGVINLDEAGHVESALANQ
ncbi:type II secretion system protein [Cerasicoccus maritimus]|uniref:type II secretion system protein n=1 Tax=Cerasicoccus maritimus TaxID=490089 RepID=UPI002852B2EE|nr:prepilin-type N-terminal cleavage/methylation domain-containing protein [Cerasicoccus maritimus]